MIKIAVIPAKKTSERLPFKNRQMLAGLAMYKHTLNAVIESGVFDEVILSTDDSIIIDAERNNSAVIIHHRKEALADDKSTVAEVCEDLLSDRKLTQGTLGVFLPTCPMRKAQHIREAWKLYEDNGMKTISVRQSKVPSWCIYAPTGPGERGKRLVDDEAGLFATNSKFVKRPWIPNGAIFMTGIPQFLHNHSFYDYEMNLYKMSDTDSLDIDTDLDLQLARIIMG